MPMTGLYKTLIPCFIEIPVSNGNSVDHDLQHLIWVYAACQCPFYGMPCLALWVNVLYKYATSPYCLLKKIKYKIGAHKN